MLNIKNNKNLLYNFNIYMKFYFNFKIVKYNCDYKII